LPLLIAILGHKPVYLATNHLDGILYVTLKIKKYIFNIVNFASIIIVLEGISHITLEKIHIANVWLCSNERILDSEISKSQNL